MGFSPPGPDKWFGSVSKELVPDLLTDAFFFNRRCPFAAPSRKAAACRKGERWKTSPPFCPVNPLFPQIPTIFTAQKHRFIPPSKKTLPNAPLPRGKKKYPTKFILGTQIEREGEK